MSFNFQDYSVKEDVREIISQKYTGGNILSLPADNFLFESKFPNAKITCCELDTETYKRGRKFKPQNVEYLNRDVFTLKGRYDFVWLDLCINLSPMLVNTFISYFQDSTAKTICLTIQGKRELFGNKLKFYGAKDLDDFRYNVFPKLLEDFSGYKVTEIYRYLSPNKSPMIVYSFEK
jgi:hypothetical protein